MELEWKTCTIGLIDLAPECVVESPFDLDMQMPDYMPDIHRILHCAVVPQIQSSAMSADRVNVEGNGLVKVIYSSEDGLLHVYEQVFPIRRSAPESVQGNAVRVSAATEYVNCRASGQRRISVNGSVSLRFAASSRREYPIPTGSDVQDLQTKTKPVSVLNASVCTEKAFVMSEVAEPESTPPIGAVLHSETVVQVDSTKAVQDKILVKGEAVTRVQYLSAEDGKTLVSFRHSMPISQVIEAVGVSETDVQDVSLHVLSAQVTPRSDGGGENKLLEIMLQIGASVVCFRQTNTQIVVDAYSTQSELQAKYSTPELRTEYEHWKEGIRIQEKTDAAGTDLQSVTMACLKNLQVGCSVQEGTLTAHCSATLGILGENSEGIPIWVEKQFAFSCRHPVTAANGTTICAPTLCVTSCQVSLSSDSELDVRAEGLLDGMIYTVEPVRLLTSAQTEPMSAENDPAALTIYFADAGERVWDIAQRYRTTVDAVSAENDLTGETIPDKSMLIIPLA